MTVSVEDGFGSKTPSQRLPTFQMRTTNKQHAAFLRSRLKIDLGWNAID